MRSNRSARSRARRAWSVWRLQVAGVTAFPAPNSREPLESCRAQAMVAVEAVEVAQALVFFPLSVLLSFQIQAISDQMPQTLPSECAQYRMVAVGYCPTPSPLVDTSAEPPQIR